MFKMYLIQHESYSHTYKMHTVPCPEMIIDTFTGKIPFKRFNSTNTVFSCEYIQVNSQEFLPQSKIFQNCLCK